jgi:hypothetical protein
MDTFNKNGSYNKTIWNLGDKITSDKLNKIEAAIYQINDTYATEEYVDNIAFGGDVDKFITKEELEAKEYLTEHQDISHLASKEELPIVPTDISAFANDIGYITDISHLASKDELPTNVSELNNDAGYLTEHQSLENYATKNYVGNERNEAMNYALSLSNKKADKDHSHEEYLTEHQSLEGLATESYVDNVIGDIDAILDAINGEVL